MPCYYPIPAVRLPTGDVSMSFGDREKGVSLELPCGSCIGCRSDYAQMWSVRMQHEAACWSSSYFLNLTYDDEHEPPLHQLQPRDPQLFLKSIRQHYGSTVESPIRFFLSGEYGPKTLRPHYHMLLFNLEITDRKKYDDEFDTSPTIDRFWQRGRVTLCPVTPRTCSYVAGYALKKITQRERRERRELIDPATGEVVWYQPPFIRCSNRPGIGALWYEKYKRDLLRGYVPKGDKKLPIPRYYLKKLKVDFPDRMAVLSEERDSRHADAFCSDPTYLHKRSVRGREAAALIAAARRRLLAKAKEL